jgi:hypothetical protein
MVSNYKILLTHLQVTTLEDINTLNKLIHDEWFDLDGIQFDPYQGLVTLPYRRKFHGGPARTVRNWLIYKIKEVDLIHAQLRVFNVEDFIVDGQENLSTDAFNIAEFNPISSTLIFHCCLGLKLRMTVSTLHIESQDLKIRGTARISYLFGLIESDRAS